MKRKIEVLVKIEREAHSGELMGWEPGDIEEAHIDKRGWAEVDWG